MNLTETLETAINAANLEPQDLAAAQLMRIYATQIENAVTRRDSKTIGELGSKLLAALTAAGMTHAGRAVKETLKGGAATDEPDPAAAAFKRLRAAWN